MHNTNKKGKFFVISGPSTVGKTVLVDALLEKIPNSKRVVTMTTRSPRKGEKDGEDYFFVTREQFIKERDEGNMLEWSEHFENLWGTSRKKLDVLLNAYDVVFATIDINGAQQVREQLKEAVTIFIQPADISDLERRQKDRGISKEEDPQGRLKRAAKEIEAASDFHHTIVNKEGAFDDTVAEALQIIQKYL